jgi:predicted transcriptional regulator
VWGTSVGFENEMDAKESRVVLVDDVGRLCYVQKGVLKHPDFRKEIEL